jgi:hypothetical protein
MTIWIILDDLPPRKARRICHLLSLLPSSFYSTARATSNFRSCAAKFVPSGCTETGSEWSP